MNYENLILKKASIVEAEEIEKLESISFPADEAASLSSIKYRLTHAAEYFYTLSSIDNGNIIGFVNGTCCQEECVLHESMTHHVEGGSSLVIHSVTMDPTYRRSGFGMKILKDYLQLILMNKRNWAEYLSFRMLHIH